MAERYVIRLTGNLSAHALASRKDDPEYLATEIAITKSRAGHYEKLGGGLTPDISEAVVVGWTAAVKRRWLEGLWQKGVYELVPVRIVPA